MDSKFRAITREGFNQFLRALSKNYNVIVPLSAGDDYLLSEFKESFTFNKYRATSSIRQFLLPSQENIGTYFNETNSKKKPFCIVGVKSCDLQSLKIQDYVFLQDPPDERYKYMRDANIIISSDCTGFKDVCFCLGLDINPYPEELFDLNISVVDDVFLVEIGSEKGQKLIEEDGNFFQNARDTYLEEKIKRREHIKNELIKHLKEQNLVSKGVLYDLIKKGYGNNLWKEEASRCVECGACIMNCPTCHCFLIFDTEQNSQFLRGRIWDGCQYKNFSKVAGGANPLLLRQKRLCNRYIKKFEFFVDNLGIYACTGCGRCIEGCIAKIDLREIFKKLVSTNNTVK